MIECVVIQWLDVNDKDYNNPSKYTILNPSYLASSLPVTGLAEDLEVLVKYMPNSIPVHDSRIVLLEVTQTPVNEPHPTHTTNNQWLISYSITERTNEDKSVSVEESEQEANLSVFPTRKQLKYLLLYTALTRREALGLTVSAEQQAILDKGDAIAAKIWQNHIEAKAKKADITAGNAINLDENWQTDEE